MAIKTASGPKLTVNDVPMAALRCIARHTVIMPNKPPLILLPAIPCDGRFYASQIEGLSDLVEAETLLFESIDIRENAASVLAQAPSRFLLAGTAYGGCLALEIAFTAPERIAGLWLMNCNPGSNPSPTEALAICARIRAGGLDQVLDEWAEVIVDPKNSGARDEFLLMAREAGAERFANQYEASARRHDHWDDLKTIAVPTLLLWGQDDRFVPMSIGRSMSDKIRDAHLVELANCRHFPTLECPTLATKAARAWVLRCLANESHPM